MNYFELHIGDYAEATAHLTFVEDAAYLRMIRKYYATEKPLPADVKAVQRLIGARSKEEREAVVSVLEEFFRLDCDGWHNARCDAEIQAFSDGEPERAAKKANEKNRTKRHRDERAMLFQIITEAGLHAHWNININELRDMAERCSGVSSQPVTSPVTAPVTAPVTSPVTAPVTSPVTSPVTAPVTPVTATHTHLPLTTTQTPILKESRATRFVPESPPPENWISFCRLERQDLDPLEVYARFTDFWAAKPGKDGTKLDWLATWRNWVRAEKQSTAPPRTRQPSSHTGFDIRDYTAGIGADGSF